MSEKENSQVHVPQSEQPDPGNFHGLTAFIEQASRKRRLISAKEACRILSVSKSHFYACVRAGIFPKPVQISEGRKAWVQDEIFGTVDRLIAARGQA
jgi:predicted DNA-binding transcriptional regulator AlpA